MLRGAEVINSLVPITQFNRGQASRIFDRLDSENQLFVLKNNQPAAVILSPKEYERLSEMEEDYGLLLEAAERLSHDKGNSIPMEEVMRKCGITEKDIDEAEEPEIE